MFRVSNNLIGILNFLVFLLSIPIILSGIWMHRRAASECDRFLDTPMIVLGVVLLLVSLAGLVGACCRVSLLLWLYLLVTFLLIVLVFCFTIFAFLVTNKGAGKVLSDRGYKEYRLGDYSHWLQKRVNNQKNWIKIKSCLIDSKYCSLLDAEYKNRTVEELRRAHLSALEAGCCKPSDDCGFTYQKPTAWTKTATNSTNPDCASWDNKPEILCYNCNSCKAGLLQNIKADWKKLAIVNVVFLIILIGVYSVGCCALRNNRHDNAYITGWKRA